MCLSPHYGILLNICFILFWFYPDYLTLSSSYNTPNFFFSNSNLLVIIRICPSLHRSTMIYFLRAGRMIHQEILMHNEYILVLLFCISGWGRILAISFSSVVCIPLYMYGICSSCHFQFLVLFFSIIYVLNLILIFYVFRDRRKHEIETASGCGLSHIGKSFRLGFQSFIWILFEALITYIVVTNLQNTPTNDRCLHSGLWCVPSWFFDPHQMRTHPIVFNSHLTCWFYIF